MSEPEKPVSRTSFSSSYNTANSFHTAASLSEDEPEIVQPPQMMSQPSESYPTVSSASDQETVSVDLEQGPAQFQPKESSTESGDGDEKASEEDDNAHMESDAEVSRQLSRVLTNAKSIEDDVRKKEAEGIPIPPMGGDRDYPPLLPDRTDYTVSFDGPNDPFHPHNWPVKKKMIQCMVIGSDTFCISFGSAVFAAGTTEISEKFHVASVVATLGVSLYVFGFATGPIVWAPLSELYGRRPILILSSFMFTVFNYAVACSDRLESILICRFFAGCLGAAPMVVVPAAFADMFGNKSRGTAIVLFSMAVFVAPLLAPFIGGFTVANHSLGWRWTAFLTGILASAAFVGVVLFQVETHHPVLLVEKAREIKRRTGNWGVHAPHDEYQLSFKEIVQNNISRPVRMLFTEPILFFITLYNAFIYGMLYLFLTAYPIVFQKGYGMAPGVAELPYFGLVIGQMLGGLFCVYSERAYNKKLDANGGKPVPEARLPPMIAGGISFPIGLLWFCWTGNYHNSIHWMVPTVSGLFTGFGLMTIFIPSMNYIIDSYLVFAASAMAANTLLRSGFGGVFPLFASFMFTNMGTNWAGLLLGLFAVVLIACPVLFVIYGKRIRQRSKFAFDL